MTSELKMSGMHPDEPVTGRGCGSGPVREASEV